MITYYVGNFTDIIECATNNGGCSQLCTNTIGSYICSCNVGYVISGDNRTCAGIYDILYSSNDKCYIIIGFVFHFL